MHAATFSIALLALAAPHEGAEDPEGTGLRTWVRILERIEEAGLDFARPITFFAPVDAALAPLQVERLEPEVLRDFVATHSAQGSLTLREAIANGRLDALGGKSFPVRFLGGRVAVGEARVVRNDQGSEVMRLHRLDAPLAPLPQAPESSMAKIRDAIEGAIARGVPLFNEGNVSGCAAVYASLAETLLTLDDGSLPPEARRALASALDAAGADGNESRRAWTLRRGLDRAWRALRDKEPERDTTMTSRPIFTFENGAEEPAWGSVNDDVMGGVSSGRARRTDDGTLQFEGELSRRNNGGFASIRSRSLPFSLEGWDGVVLRVRGDGRTYGFSTLPSANRMEVRAWRSWFETKKGEWIDVRIPFDALELSVMGRSFPDQRPLQGREIRAFSIIVADKIEAPFALEVESITAYRAAE